MATRLPVLDSVPWLPIQSRWSSGCRSSASGEPAGEPGVASGVGMEVVGADRQRGRVDPVVGVGQVDDLREPALVRQPISTCVRSAGSGGLAHARDQDQDARHAARPAVGDDRAVDPGEEGLAEGPEHALVGLGRSAGLARPRRPGRRGRPARPSRSRGAGGRGAGARPSRRRPGVDSKRTRSGAIVQPTREKWSQRWPGPCPGTAKLRISTAGPPARCDRSSRLRSRSGSKPSPSLTPQPAPIESPTKAIRNVRGGLAVVYSRSRIPSALVLHRAPSWSNVRFGLSTNSRRSSTATASGPASNGGASRWSQPVRPLAAAAAASSSRPAGAPSWRRPASSRCS